VARPQVEVCASKSIGERVPYLVRKISRTYGESFTISRLRTNLPLQLSSGTHRGLYAIEKEIRGRPPDERREVRNTRSRPLLESLKQWSRKLRKLSEKIRYRHGRSYALGRLEALLRFCDDGGIEIDNNAAERALRVVLWAERIFFLRVPMVVERVPRRFTVCSVRPS